MGHMDLINRTVIVSGQSKGISDYALASARNTLLAAGAKIACTDIDILVPDYAFKSRMNTMKKIVVETCREQDIPISHIRTEKTAAVSTSMSIVHTVGTNDEAEAIHRVPMEAGQSIVLTKWAGMEGMLRIAEEKEVQMEKRFSTFFNNQIQRFREKIWDISELPIIREHKYSVLRQVTQGGIFAALWDLAKDYKTGLDVELKHIVILQETIEVCEYFRLNPYQLASAGCFLIVANDGDELVQKLTGQGVCANVIGKTTDNNDKIIRNQEEVRYIDRPAPDEIHKIGI